MNTSKAKNSRAAAAAVRIPSLSFSHPATPDPGWLPCSICSYSSAVGLFRTPRPCSLPVAAAQLFCLSPGPGWPSPRPGTIVPLIHAATHWPPVSPSFCPVPACQAPCLPGLPGVPAGSRSPILDFGHCLSLSGHVAQLHFHNLYHLGLVSVGERSPQGVPCYYN